MDLLILRRTAAEIAAAAVYELYPEIELLGGGETSTGFSYNFYFPHPLHPHIIEEKMRQIIRERRPIRTLEMVPFSASELLKAEGHLARIEDLEGDEGLVQLIQIGTFHDLCPGPHLKNTAELAAFKISIEALPEKKIRITGWCHHSKEELKEFLKKIENYTEPEKIGERMGLWKDSIWLPEGLKRRNVLIQYLKGQWFEGSYEISGPFGADKTELHRSLGKPKVAEIWTRFSSDSAGQPCQETCIQISFFAKPEQEAISFLQSIGKTLTILGFDPSPLSMGLVTEFMVVDGLGRRESLIRAEKVLKKGSSAIDMIVTATVEKILTLLLEKEPDLQMVNIEN